MLKAVLLLLLGVVACVWARPGDAYLRWEGEEPEALAEVGNVLEEAGKLGLSRLVQAVQAAGLAEVVTDNTLTVFAPSNEAIEKLPQHVVDYLSKNKTALQELLSYHAVTQVVKSAQIENDMLAPSADPNTDNIRLNVYMNGMNKMVDAEGSKVVVADHQASNGVLHVIDCVMYPIPRLTIAQYLKRDRMYFSTLLTALQAADLTDMLMGQGPFTLFAPDDAAFKKLPKGVLDNLLKDKMKLKAVLSYHVAKMTYFANGLPKSIKTVQGGSLMVKMMDDKVMINNAVVDYPDRKVTNGVIHVIDHVLLPPTLDAAAPDAGNIIQEARTLGLNTMLKLADTAGLTEMAEENMLTLMAPTDAAFARLPKSLLDELNKNMTLLQEVLSFHAIPDAIVMSKDIMNDELAASADMMMDNVRFNIYKPKMGAQIVTSDGVRVVKADNMASNGVIHVIDGVMFPLPTMNIVDLLTRDQQYFSTLLDAGKVAGLTDQLTGYGPFTLFAPDDAAFKKLPKGVLDNLLKDKAKLTDVLMYHVLEGTVYSAGLFNGTSYMTSEGQNVNVKVMDTPLKPMVHVNNAMVKYADISASNGVVHVIDTVLMPPSMR